MAKKPVPAPEPPRASRAERIVAYMFAGILGISLIAMVSLFVMVISGHVAKGNLWAAVALIPIVGFALAILLLIALVVLNILRRGRAAKVAGK